MAFSQSLQPPPLVRLHKSSTPVRFSSLPSSSSSLSFRFSPSFLNRKKPFLSIKSASVEGTIISYLRISSHLLSWFWVVKVKKLSVVLLIQFLRIWENCSRICVFCRSLQLSRLNRGYLMEIGQLNWLYQSKMLGVLILVWAVLCVMFDIWIRDWIFELALAWLFLGIWFLNLHLIRCNRTQ